MTIDDAISRIEWDMPAADGTEHRALFRVESVRAIVAELRRLRSALPRTAEAIKSMVKVRPSRLESGWFVISVADMDVDRMPFHSAEAFAESLRNNIAAALDAGRGE